MQVDELVPREHPVAQGELHHAEDDLLLGQRLDEVLQPAVARGDAFHAVELLVALRARSDLRKRALVSKELEHNHSCEQEQKQVEK